MTEKKVISEHTLVWLKSKIKLTKGWGEESLIQEKKKKKTNVYMVGYTDY